VSGGSDGRTPYSAQDGIAAGMSKARRCPGLFLCQINMCAACITAQVGRTAAAWAMDAPVSHGRRKLPADIIV
jgi:hypothetical protein